MIGTTDTYKFVYTDHILLKTGYRRHTLGSINPGKISPKKPAQAIVLCPKSVLMCDGKESLIGEE